MITYGFFNSVNGDRLYNAEQISDMFKGLLSDGVYNTVDAAFAVTPGGGMRVQVGAGRAIVDDRWIDNSAPVLLTISPANSALGRIDNVVLRKDLAARTVDLLVVTGTPASQPVAPAVQRTDEVYELLLARITVPAGTTAITSTHITDTRGSALCGWVTGLVRQVNTDSLWAQFAAAYQDKLDTLDDWEAESKAAFDAWFDDLTQELRVDTVITKDRTTAVITSDNTGAITAPQYDAGDVVEVYANGRLLQAEEYAVSGSGGTITFYADRRPGDVVQVTVTHAAVGTA